MIKGWEIALKSMKVGERSVVRIENPELGYGSEGFPPVIPPNAAIEVDLEVLEVSPPMNPFEFDKMVESDNVTPVRALLLFVTMHMNYVNADIFLFRNCLLLNNTIILILNI